jgi:hypothetical protein
VTRLNAAIDAMFRYVFSSSCARCVETSMSVHMLRPFLLMPHENPPPL